MNKRILVTLLALAATAVAQHPRDTDIHDPDTLAWWHTTEDLSGDAMEGRDTGSAAYLRAAEYTADRFKAAGLKPAGENGGYFQTIPMHEVGIDPTSVTISFTQRPGGRLNLQFLQEFTINPAEGLPGDIEGAMTFRGYCGKDAMDDVLGKIVFCFGTQRAGLPTAGERVANARNGGALGVVNIDDPYFTIEPPRWPFAYARAVANGPAPKQAPNALPVMRISEEAFTKLLAKNDHDAATLFRTGGAKESLANFDIPGRMHVVLKLYRRTFSSPNILAMLPGSDPRLKDEVLVVAAHLDGYGFGAAVTGDNLYNGTLDDAAYVALLIQLAENFKSGKLPQPKRSILFCAFTGEEKGLLGANWFIEHPTVAKERLVADINLDQLRPLFPLKLMTALAIHDTTLGETATKVGKGMGITLREDPEPERGLLRRADHWPFLKAGIPAIGFIFGYEPGTDEEKRYREWYQVRYHRPQDDLTQPMDFDAAAKFDSFFYKLVETVADAKTKPEMLNK